MRTQTIIIGLIAFIAIGILTAQYSSIRSLKSELASMRTELGTTSPSQETRAPETRTTIMRDAGLESRVSDLESAVAQLTSAAEILMRRGQLPLGTNQFQEFLNQFGDVNAQDRDRLSALRQLRRAGPLSDQVVQQAVDWLRSSTNGNLREDILGQLEGVTNAVFRDPLLQLAASEMDPDARQQAIENLEAFASDPKVEEQLWKSILNDPNPEVREEAQEVLVEGPMTDTRMALLKQRALNSQATVDEKLTALLALNEADVVVPEATAALAQLAQTTTDQELRLKLFRGFEDMNDPTVRLPLVQGLQDSNPLIRELAADALREHRTDPAVAEWLRHVAQTDPDSGVRREALQALDDD